MTVINAISASTPQSDAVLDDGDRFFLNAIIHRDCHPPSSSILKSQRPTSDLLLQNTPFLILHK
jgi:hypothetical protein